MSGLGNVPNNLREDLTDIQTEKTKKKDLSP
jgi:hypothetical protein